MGVVLEEADEAQYRLSLAQRAALVESKFIDQLLNESHELSAIFASSILTAKQRT